MLGVSQRLESENSNREECFTHIDNEQVCYLALVQKLMAILNHYSKF